MKPYFFVKQILDFCFALILLVLISPIMMGAAVLIRIDSPGPILFKQQRPGMNGKLFYVFKFRTMKVQAKMGDRLSDMERMSKIGSILRRLSIDELPQIFNILRGEMSFIGPRPLLEQYLDHYTEEQMRRHEVKPGISGWAQVNGRNCLKWEEKFILDVWYVDNISFWLDMKILFLTVKSIIKRKGVNNSQFDTMPLFNRRQSRTSKRKM